MGNILSTLSDLITPQLLSQASKKLGEDSSGIEKAISGLLPTLLGGLIQKTDDRSGFSNIFNLLNDDKNAGFLDNLSGLIGGGNLAQGDPKDIAGNLMGNLFGDKVGGILDLVSSFAGIKKSSTSSLLGLVGPMLMGFLGKQIKSKGLDMAGLISMLLGQKNNVMSALPSGMGDLLGFGAAAASGSTSQNTPKAKSATSRLPWLILGILALLAAIYFMKGCDETPKVDTSAVSTVVDDAKDMAESAGDKVVESVTGLGEFFTRKLKCGTALSIPENGIEAGVISFIEDTNKAIDKTTWFNFDRLIFETGKANLEMEESMEQLKNIAEILKCYPKVKVKIGGYTDNTGNPDFNLKLSQDRANSVTTALVGLGIAVDRMDAEGYGIEHPVASNETEEGRAKNRRIALRVTEK